VVLREERRDGEAWVTFLAFLDRLATGSGELGIDHVACLLLALPPPTGTRVFTEESTSTEDTMLSGVDGDTG